LLVLPQMMSEVRRSISTSKRKVVIDTETNWLKKNESSRLRYCLGVAIKTDTDKYYIPVQHSDWLLKCENIDIPKDFFSDVTCDVIMHNAKFDLQVLENLGIQVPTDKLTCTMLMHHYIDVYPPHDLDQLGAKYLGIRKEKDLKEAMKKEWDRMPAQVMGPYAEQDTEIPYQLHDVLLPNFQEFQPLWESHDRDFMLCLKEIEQKGIRINRELAEKLDDQCHRRMEELTAQLGFDPAKPSQLHPKLFAAPPRGLGLVPSEVSPKTGKPTVSDSYLESVGHPVTALVQEYRGLAKQSSSYYGSYCRLTSWDYPRLHPNFKIHGTVTARLSCENPNLQQIPRESDDNQVKQLFLPDEGKQLWELDFANIEYRLTALYANEKSMIDAFKEGRDFHQLVADDLGISRQQAKVVNFLMIYGGTASALSVQLGCSWKKADTIIDNYFSAYPKVREVSQAAEDKARESSEIKYWTGRKRNFRYESESRKAFNSLVQGGSFEIMKWGMLNCWKAGVDMRNQVHDAVWVNVDKEEEVVEIGHLLSDWTEEAFGLKFPVDIKRLN
jgi:DNA polymerase-1